MLLVIYSSIILSNFVYVTINYTQDEQTRRIKEENQRLEGQLKQAREVCQDKKMAVEKQEQSIDNLKKLQKDNQDKLRATQNEIKLAEKNSQDLANKIQQKNEQLKRAQNEWKNVQQTQNQLAQGDDWLLEKYKGIKMKKKTKS